KDFFVNQSLLLVERARDDIRRGMPIILTDNINDKDGVSSEFKDYLLFSAEDFVAGPEIYLSLLADLGVSNVKMVVTWQREKFLESATFLPDSEIPSCCATGACRANADLPVDSSVQYNKQRSNTQQNNKPQNNKPKVDSESYICDIAINQHENIAQHVHNIMVGKDNAEVSLKVGSAFTDIALKFIKLTQFLPSIVIVPLGADQKDKVANFINISAENILDYYKLNKHQGYEYDLETVCNTQLKLSEVSKAKILSYRPKIGGSEHYALIIGDPFKDKIPLVRMHSSCYTGDLLKSMTCDCYNQLHLAMKIMDQYYIDYNAGKESKFSGGIVLYLMQEGRGIGLTNKLRAYNFQAEGLDTVDANNIIGFNNDERDYTIASLILENLAINQISLLTNNPDKVKQLNTYNININQTIPLITPSNEYNKEYMKVKAERLNHKF
ncbi:MAG: GTP cyclohydrolase II, partial [Pseudomonadota bacterium]